jgi:hypothetical protein
MSKRVNLKAIALDGVNDHVLVPDQDDFSFTDGTTDKPFTLSAWVFVGDVTSDDGPIVAKTNFTNSKSEWLFKHSNGKLQVFLYDNDNSVSGEAIRARADAASLSSNTWHHVAATYDGSTSHTGIKVYTDGSLTVSTNGEVNSPGEEYIRQRATTTPLIIGATEDLANANRRFEDRIADVCVFNKELSATEVSELYNGGHVKNMLKASTYSDLISWWKLGDDLDSDTSGGMRDYVSGYNGTLTNGASIVAAPALPTDRIRPEGRIPTSFGRTRQPKNVAGDHQVYIHGGVGGNMPTAAPTTATQGYATENQRYLQVYWKADQTNTTHTITAWGYSHASQVWSELYDTSGTQVRLTTTNAAVDTFRVFEVAGVDRVYFRQSDDALAATDLFAAATSTF